MPSKFFGPVGSGKPLRTIEKLTQRAVDPDWKNDGRMHGRDKDPWLYTDDEILAVMQAEGGWFRFSEFDNIAAVRELLKEGKIEADPNWNNRISGMVTSVRARVK